MMLSGSRPVILKPFCPLDHFIRVKDLQITYPTCACLPLQNNFIRFNQKYGAASVDALVRCCSEQESFRLVPSFVLRYFFCFVSSASVENLILWLYIDGKDSMCFTAVLQVQDTWTIHED